MKPKQTATLSTPDRILAALKAERARLQEAIDALSGGSELSHTDKARIVGLRKHNWSVPEIAENLASPCP